MAGFFVFILMAMTMIELIYLIVYVPFDTQLLQSLEVFNEMTSMILLYTTLAFTDWLRSETFENNLGWVFNSAMAINICVHLYFMIRNTINDCKKKCKERKAKKMIKEGERLAGQKPFDNPKGDDQNKEVL